MDKKIERKKWPLKRILVWIFIPLLVVLLLSLVFTSGQPTFKTDASRVSVSSVVLDEFQDIVSIQGTVEPITSILLDATEGGVVEEIFTEDGAIVEKGSPLLRLSNASLTLDFMNRETQIVEQINNLRSTRISLDQNKRQVQEQILDFNYQFKEQFRKWKRDSALFQNQVISQEEFAASKSNYHYLQKRISLLKERFKTDEAYRESQLHRIDASVLMMERNLDAIRANLENLVVRAPISGQLNSFDHELGQTKSRGENLGRIDVLDQYQISAQVDQYYLNRLQVGLKAEVEIAGKIYALEIKKVLPTVVNNQFEIQLKFLNELPPNIRRGQNLPLKLELSAKTISLMLNKGAFYLSTGGKYVFVVGPDGNATKREVQFGAQNPFFIQVLNGLQEGEKVITSSYDAFGDAERIILKNYKI